MKWNLLSAGVFLCAASWAHSGDVDTQIVSQGGTIVTLADVGAYMQHMPENRWAGFLDSPKRVDQMVIGILRNKQLQQQAIEMKLDQDPSVKAEIAFVTMEVLSRRRMTAFEKSVTYPSMEAAAREQYMVHQKDYAVPANVEVQHVLVSTHGRTDADAKALAEKVRAEAMASPSGFDELVKKYSEDPSKDSNTGHIPDATSDKLAPEFADAAGKLQKKDQISPVIKTQFGYHVLRLVQSEPARPLEFAQVKDKIVAKLKENYLAEQRQAFLLKFDEGQPTVNPDIAKLIRERFVPAGTVTPAQAATGKKD